MSFVSHCISTIGVHFVCHYTPMYKTNSMMSGQSSIESQHVNKVLENPGFVNLQLPTYIPPTLSSRPISGNHLRYCTYSQQSM